jgi:hypothetical protein
MDLAVNKSTSLLQETNCTKWWEWWPVITRSIPELLEEYMQPHGGTGLWVTVPEFRTYFALNERSLPAISGFFRRLYHRPFFTCPYRVTRIEKQMVTTPQTRMIKRYFITRKTTRQWEH